MNHPPYALTALFVGSGATFDAHSQSDRDSVLTVAPDTVRIVHGVYKGQRENTVVLTYLRHTGPSLAREAARIAHLADQETVLIVRLAADSDTTAYRVRERDALPTDLGYTDWDGVLMTTYVPDPEGDLTAYLIDRHGHISALSA